MDTIRDLGFDVNSISDLTELDQREPDSAVLVVGNAWAAFEDAEIDAVGRFVAGGGQVLLVGLHWSWEQYRTSANLNPCTFNPYSRSRERALEVYPMNALGKQFGISYESGTLPVQ
jgi:hypothetical protein